MPSTLSTIEAILKTDYLPKIRENVNNESNFFVMKMKQNQTKISGGGKGFHIPLHWGRNNSVQATTEMGTLPAAGQQGYQPGVGNVAFIHGRLQVSNATIQASKSDEVAYARNLTQEVKGLTTDTQNYMKQSIMGSSTGILSATKVTASGTTINVTNPYAYFEGQRVDLVSGGTVTNSNRLVTAVNYDAGTISVSGAAFATTANEYFVTSGSFGLNPIGLQDVISATSTLHGVNPATNSWWKSTVIGDSASPAALTLEKIRLLLDRVQAASGVKSNFLSTSYGVRAVYESLLQAQKRFVNTMDLEGGYKAIEFDGIPMLTDNYAPNGEIWAGHFDHLQWYYTSELDFLDADGSMFSRVPNVAAYEATIFEYGTLVCDRRNAFGKLVGVTQASGY